MISKFKAAAEAIKNSNHLVISAGSGLGTESGIPHFKGKDGFVRTFPQYAKHGMTLPEVASPSWFHKDPRFAWGFWGYSYNLYKQKHPHKGFDILKAWASKKALGYTVYTSNVDGHFQKAGFDQQFVQECHGNINFLQCVDNHKCIGDVWEVQDLQIEVDSELLAQGPLPTCKHCGGLARPNVQMFGDWGWVADRSEAQAELFEDQYRGVESAKDRRVVVIELGAGLAVPIVRRFGETFLYREPSSVLIRVNPKDEKSNDKGLINLPFSALSALEEIQGLIDE